MLLLLSRISLCYIIMPSFIFLGSDFVVKFLVFSIFAVISVNSVAIPPLMTDEKYLRNMYHEINKETCTLI